MIKLSILSVGKTKELWLQDAIKEYEKRLQPVATFDHLWVKNDEQLIHAAHACSHPICLDPAGKLLTSEAFSKFVMHHIEHEGSCATFIIGGPDGLPKSLKESGILISLSPLTFTHQITRLVLVEQLYRAFEIAKGTAYHR